MRYPTFSDLTNLEKWRSVQDQLLDTYRIIYDRAYDEPEKNLGKSVQSLTFHVRECTLVIEGQSREIKWLDKCFYVKSATKWLLSGPMILGEDVTSAIHAVQSLPREIPNWFHSQVLTLRQNFRIVKSAKCGIDHIEIFGLGLTFRNIPC